MTLVTQQVTQRLKEKADLKRQQKQEFELYKVNQQQELHYKNTSAFNDKHIVDSMSSISESVVEPCVADPASWIERRKEAARLCWDAVPVYLDCSTGKITTSHHRLPHTAQTARTNAFNAQTSYGAARVAAMCIALELSLAPLGTLNALAGKTILD